MNSQIFKRLTTTSQMMSIFGDESMLIAMLEFESALATAESRCEVFDPRIAETISDCCQISEFSIPDLSELAVQHGTVVVPLVKQLTKLVSVKDETASGWVHFGATSQDVIDTAMIIQIKKACALLENDINRLVSALESLGSRFGSQVMIGRTLLQPSVPITFGQKISGWKSAINRNWKRIEVSAKEALVLQFGGPSGNLSSLGLQGEQVRETLSRIIDLPLPTDAWHVHRDRLVSLCSCISILVGSLGKMALDLSLLMQSEVGEVSEGNNSDGGRSSAMPHKRNPVNCLIALTAAKRTPHLQATLLEAMVQEHERALGGWQAEWLTVPAIFEAAAGSISAIADMCGGLQIHPEKMLHNLDALKGLFMSERIMLALSKKIGKESAREILEEACSKVQSQDRHLSELLKLDTRFTQQIGSDELDELMNIKGYLGTSSIGD